MPHIDRPVVDYVSIKFKSYIAIQLVILLNTKGYSAPQRPRVLRISGDNPCGNAHTMVTEATEYS